MVQYNSMGYSKFKDKIKSLRISGKTYSEINRILCLNIPKSTLSYYCSKLVVPAHHKNRINEMMLKNLDNARKKAVAIRRGDKIKRTAAFYKKNNRLLNYFNNNDVVKIVLGALYLGEGSKGKRWGLTFGNSDEKIIKLFLSLLRTAFNANENKLHCTLQCRNGADVDSLKKYWSGVTGIPLIRFYKTQIDRRYNMGPEMKAGYKGVCRIDYISSVAFEETMIIGDVICKYSK